MSRLEAGVNRSSISSNYNTVSSIIINVIIIIIINSSSSNNSKSSIFSSFTVPSPTQAFRIIIHTFSSSSSYSNSSSFSSSSIINSTFIIIITASTHLMRTLSMMPGTNSNITRVSHLTLGLTTASSLRRRTSCALMVTHALRSPFLFSEHPSEVEGGATRATCAGEG